MKIEQLAVGIAPSVARQREKRTAAVVAANTFEQVGREWLQMKQPRWVASYSERLMSRLEADVFPALGARTIKDVDAPEVLEMIWKVEARDASELAKREMQVIGQISRFAIATGQAKRDLTAASGAHLCQQ